MKRSNRITYGIFKHVLGPLFKLYYHPKILGKEKIWLHLVCGHVNAQNTVF